MTSRNQKIGEAFDRLFRTYPQADRGGPEDAVRERIERARVYFEAVAQYEVRDIEAAVANFLSGSAPGVNPSFAPPAPAVAAETRRVMNLRLDAESRRFAPRNQLPAPTIERAPESRARVAAMVEQAVSGLASEMRTPDAEEARRKAAFQSRVFARFDPMNEREVAERLGYTVAQSDPDGDMGMGDAA